MEKMSGEIEGQQEKEIITSDSSTPSEQNERL